MNEKNIDMTKVNMHIKRDMEVNHPHITNKIYPYLGKKTYYHKTYPTILKPRTTLRNVAVSETSRIYQPTLGKSNCPLTYHDFQNLDIQVNALNSSDSFEVRLSQIYYSYMFSTSVSFEDNKGYQDKAGFKTYMSQINFATHCATTACGISSEHLNCHNDMLRKIYRFHVAFQTRKILNSLGVVLPYADNFKPFNSIFMLEVYHKLCREYKISPVTDWRYKFIDKRFMMDKDTGEPILSNTIMGWIADKCNGLTLAGVRKLSESVRAYTFLVLSAQANARSGIVGNDGKALDAQQIFISSFEEDLIMKSTQVTDEITRYQDVLDKASSKVDFSVGSGVYMLPHDLRLWLNADTKGFNNKILVSNSNIQLGLNHNVSLVKPKKHQILKNEPEKKRAVRKLPHHERIQAEKHEDEKKAVTVLCIGTSMLLFYFFM